MQLRPGRWRPFRAEQEIGVDRVELVWRARFPVLPFAPIRVLDWCRGQAGGLEVRFLGLLVRRVSGPGVARGQVLRYLAELPWAPQAMLANAALEWRAVDERTVQVTAPAAGEPATVLLHFDAAGDVVAVSCQARPREVGGRFVDTPFGGSFSHYATLAGVRVPTRAEARWELPDGPYPYFRARLVRYEPDGGSAAGIRPPW